MSIGIDFISVPKEVDVKPNWLDTPEFDSSEEKINQIAQSRLASWTDAGLDNLKFALNTVQVASIIGIGAAIYYSFIPGIILGGITLTVCLIGKNAIHREYIQRCKQNCLELENWCHQFTQACENLKETFEELVDNAQEITDETDEIEDTEGELLEAFRGLPSNDLKALAKKLKARHIQLFGEKRSIGNGSWSTHWIKHHLKYRFGSHLDTFYRIESIYREKLEKREKILQSKSYSILTNLNLEDRKIEPLPRSEAAKRAFMTSLTDRFDTSPQGQDDFKHIIEEAEYWRQNIAIFRSSL